MLIEYLIRVSINLQPVENKMASAAAALLDELMGRNRNAHPDDKGGNIRWDSEEVATRAWFICLVFYNRYKMQML